MELIKSAVSDWAKNLNAASDEMLAWQMRRRRRDLQRQWRAVKSAATALLDFVHQPLTLTPRSRARIKRQLTEISPYGEMSWLSWLPSSTAENLRISDRDLRLAHAETRNAFARLVLAYRPETSLPPPATAWWQPPECTVSVGLARVRADAIGGTREVKPRHMEVVFSAVAVLQMAVLWLRFCELCGRLFFKVRKQQYCSRGHAIVGRGRARSRKGDQSERRGRPRYDYAIPVMAEYAAWLHKAARTSGRQP